MAKLVFFFLSIFSIIWFVFLLGFALPVTDTGTCIPRPVTWLPDYLSCLKPNELGDLLAGMFAPVAFAWFLATVILQYLEISENRQIAEKQSEYMGVQTQHIVRAASDASAEKVFDANVARLATRLRQYDHAFTFSAGSEKLMFLKTTKYEEISDESTIAHVGQDVARVAREALNKHTDLFEADYPKDFTNILTALNECIDAGKLLPPQAIVRADLLELPRFKVWMDALVKRATNLPAPPSIFLPTFLK